VTDEFHALRRLAELQHALSREADPNRWDEEGPRLLLGETGGLVDLAFYGSPFDDPFFDLQEILAEPEVAPQVRSLSFRGPDAGANGTRHWDFGPLVGSEAHFPGLRSLFIEPTLPEHHNASILGEGYEEDGMLAGLLQRMPALERLTSPSAPDQRFFEVGARPLAYLRVETGYDRQDFLRNFNASSCFPGLQVLEFGDFDDRSAPEYPESCATYEEYGALFRSAAFAPVKYFILRNPALSREQLQALKALRPKLLFRVIHSHGEYL